MIEQLPGSIQYQMLEQLPGSIQYQMIEQQQVLFNTR